MTCDVCVDVVGLLDKMQSESVGPGRHAYAIHCPACRRRWCCEGDAPPAPLLLPDPALWTTVKP